MFSGLIGFTGTVAALERDPRGGARLRIETRASLDADVEPKDSIAVSGVCLTVAALGSRSLEFDVVPETLERSILGSLAPGAAVNLELSLRLGDRLGGHLVYGHVDATARILVKTPEGQGHRLRIETPAALAQFIAEKGYIAIDGVSLTIAATRVGTFDIALIPETSARTTLGTKGTGHAVNLEIDPIARYVVHAAQHYDRGGRPSSAELDWAYEI